MNTIAKVCHNLQITEDEYWLLFWENALLYLDKFTTIKTTQGLIHDEYTVRALTHSPDFWTWYRQYYTLMDKAYFESKFSNAPNMKYRLKFYKLKHTNLSLYPFKRIIENSYKNYEKYKTGNKALKEADNIQP